MKLRNPVDLATLTWFEAEEVISDGDRVIMIVSAAEGLLGRRFLFLFAR